MVGAGPIGLETAAGLARAGLDVEVIEAGSVGWTFGWWAAGTRFFSSPERIGICGVPLAMAGQDKTTREDYRAYLWQVARSEGLAMRQRTLVRAIDPGTSGFALQLSRSAVGVGGPSGETDAGSRGDAGEGSVRCRKLVLAIGNMHRGRRLGIPGEDLAHVSHYLDDPQEYAGQRVLIVGGRNSAVEAAIRLYRVGAAVTMSYRGAGFDRDRIKYWLMPELEWLIGKGRIGFLAQSELTGIDGAGVDVAVDGRATRLECEHVLLLTGYEQDSSLFESAGLELVGEERRPKYDRSTMESSVPGLFVAGTAIAGTQRRTRVFIENAHIHADRICRAVTRELLGDERGVPWAVDPSAGAEFGSLEES